MTLIPQRLVLCFWGISCKQWWNLHHFLNTWQQQNTSCSRDIDLSSFFLCVDLVLPAISATQQFTDKKKEQYEDKITLRQNLSIFIKIYRLKAAQLLIDKFFFDLRAIIYIISDMLVKSTRVNNIILDLFAFEKAA